MKIGLSESPIVKALLKRQHGRTYPKGTVLFLGRAQCSHYCPITTQERKYRLKCLKWSEQKRPFFMTAISAVQRLPQLK